MLFRTATAVRLNVFVKIFFTIVVGELFALFDIPDRIDENASAFYLWVTVGTTGMIDIACDVCTSRAVNRSARIHFKEVLATARVFLSVCEGPTNIFNDARPFPEGTCREEPEPSARLPHPKSFGIDSFLCTHTYILVYTMLSEFEPNKGKKLDTVVAGTRYLRLPIKTRLIEQEDNLLKLLEVYVAPHLISGDMLFVSEKIVCITQGRIIHRDLVKTSWLARLLAGKVRNHVGTPQFRGFGHGTAPAMQLLIEEAGYPRVLFAAGIAALTRPLGIRGAFYYLVGKQAKSIDCPMSFTLEQFKDYAKRAPLTPNKVAREIHDTFGVETVIVDANYRGAFSLGKSTRTISEKFIRELLADNPAGQDSEMTPFFIIRRAPTV